jgi:hypothetical protein
MTPNSKFQNSENRADNTSKITAKIFSLRAK